MKGRTANDESTYVYVSFYEHPQVDPDWLNEAINRDADKIAAAGAAVLGIEVKPAEFHDNYTTVIIHYRATGYVVIREEGG
jgi:hypothetical protein